MEALAVGFLGILVVVLAIVLVIAILYLLTLQKALSRVSPRNRLMEPGMVWLMLIPCFNIVWQFFIAVRVPGSLQNEFRDRGRDDGSDYGKGIALTQCILGLISGVVSNVLQRSGDQDLAVVGGGVSGVMSIIGLVLFIMFWVKIANYSNQLANDDGVRQRDIDRKLEQFDDDDDDRPPAKRDPGGPSPDTYKEGDPGRYQ